MSIISPVEFNDNIVDIYIPKVSRRYCPIAVSVFCNIENRQTNKQTYKEIYTLFYTTKTTRHRLK